METAGRRPYPSPSIKNRHRDIYREKPYGDYDENPEDYNVPRGDRGFRVAGSRPREDHPGEAYVGEYEMEVREALRPERAAGSRHAFSNPVRKKPAIMLE